MKEKDRPLHEINDPLWLADLAFLVDLTDHLTTLNKSLQGKEQLVPQLYALMKAFCVKLNLFKTQLRNFNVVHFPTLRSELIIHRPTFLLKKGNMCLITCLETEFRQRFQDFSVIEKEIKLLATPFLVDAEEVEENMQLELIKIQCDDSLKNLHQQLSLPEFYRSLEQEKNDQSIWLRFAP